MPFKNPHPLYQIWQGMKARCLNPNNPHYANYGGRGIKICDEWINNFNQFVADMKDRPCGYSIDRIDNNGDYTPNNCKWSTKKEQQRNRRITKKIIINNGGYSLFLAITAAGTAIAITAIAVAATILARVEKRPKNRFILNLLKLLIN